jgi:hypothetical protein
MALLEWLDGDAAASRSFAALPEVRAGLDQVFRVPVNQLHSPPAKHGEVQVVATAANVPKPANSKPVKAADYVEVSKRN